MPILALISVSACLALVPPAPAPPDESGAARIITLSGKVRFRASEESPWQSGSVGSVMPQGSVVETGIRSTVEIHIGAGQTLTIDRVSRVALAEISRRDRTDKTTLELPYGRVRFDVSSATIANDVQIQAPDAILAVKGTQGLMQVDAGMPTLAEGALRNTGIFQVRFRESGVTATLRDQNRADARNPSPAGALLQGLRIDPGASQARQRDERQALDRQPGGAGLGPPGGQLPPRIRR